MKDLKKLFETGSYIYGYYNDTKGFVPYYDSECLKITVIYCKETQRIFAI